MEDQQEAGLALITIRLLAERATLRNRVVQTKFKGDRAAYDEWLEKFTQNHDNPATRNQIEINLLRGLTEVPRDCEAHGPQHQCF